MSLLVPMWCPFNDWSECVGSWVDARPESA
jgi:hypothetical protein